MLETHLNLIRLTCLCLKSCTGRCGAPSVLSHLTFSVDVEFEVADRFHVHHIFTCFLRCENGLVLGRKIFQVHAWGKVVHTCCGDSQWSRIIFSRHRLSFHLRIVPESTLQTLLAIDGTIRSHQAIHHLVVGTIATCQIEQILLLGLDTVKNGDGAIRCTIVVTPHQRFIVSIRTNHSNLLLVLLQRQHIALVLQEHQSLASHIERDLAMFLRIHC